MNQYIIAHDLGTSGNKATLYSLDGRLCGSALYEYPVYYPANLYAEQEPMDWWNAVCNTTKQLISTAGISAKDIATISFSGQMMGCLLVDKSGEPLGRSIIWADMRAEKQARQMETLIGMEKVYKITGHRISSSYSAAKLLWIKDNQPERYAKGYKMLHAKDFIILKLTGRFATDYSDASGTNLFDLKKKEWSEDISMATEIHLDILPELCKSTDIAGYVTKEAAEQTGLLEGTPVVFGGGDGCCAAAGAGICQEGEIYNVIGSSSWIATATKEPVYDKLMRTFNWAHLDPELYSPCGTMQAAGLSYNWLKNTLCQTEIEKSKETGENVYQLINKIVDTSPAGSKGLLFLPYLLGERSPRWNAKATAAFIGAKVTTTQADIYRSVLEGVGYNLKVILDIFNEQTNYKRITVIGGGAKGDVWLQILSDVWQKEIAVPVYLEEATSMGAAICGGIGVGAFKDFHEIKKFNPIHKMFKPRTENKEVYEKMYRSFNLSYESLVKVYEELSAI